MAEDLENRSERSRADVTALTHESQRRETVLSCLSRFDDAVTLADLADEVAVEETASPITSISGDYIKEVYLTLYHAEIPYLVDQGILAYDQESDLLTVKSEQGLSKLLDDIRSPNR